jgi:hypothetical protein
VGLVVEQRAVKWSFAKRWRWRLKAVRELGLFALLLPADVTKDDTVFALEALFAAIHGVPLEGGIPYIEKLHQLALDVVAPRLWGVDFVPPEVTVDDVAREAGSLLDFVDELRKRDENVARIVKELAHSFTSTVYYAIEELAIIEGSEELQRMADSLYYLKYAIASGRREYIEYARGA